MHKVEDTVFHLFDSQRQAFLARKTRLFSEYMQSLAKYLPENLLVSCTGWNEPPKDISFSRPLLQQLFAPNHETCQQGGYFFRYNQAGVCINPGFDFFERFSESGFHLWHIDTVIVTEDEERFSGNLELIHQFNRELNQTLASHDQERRAGK